MGGGVSKEKLSRFFRSVAMLLSSGVGILKSLEYLADDDSVEFSVAVEEVARGLGEGRAFSRTLREQPGIFDKMSCDLIEAGEKCGQLPQTLVRLADHHARGSMLERRLVAVLAYPVVIAVMMVLMLVGMVWFVFPREKELLESVNADVPWITTLVFEGLGFFFHPLFVVSVLGLAAMAMVTLSGRQEQGEWTASIRKVIDEKLLSLPLFGDMILQLSLSRMLHVFSMLGDAGCTMDTSLRCSGNVMQNKVLEAGVDAARQNLKAGMGLTEAISQTEVFPTLFVQLFAVAEETGRLVPVSSKLAKIYEDRLETSLDTVTSLIEPIALLVIGTLIGFLLLATMLPTASIMGTL